MTPQRAERIASAVATRQLDLCVILENVHDPHNIGAVLRTCDSIGIQEVYILITDPQMNPDTYFLSKRASSGARKWIDCYLYTDTDQCIADVRKKYDRILGTKLNETSKSVYDFDFTQSTAIAFGNEHDVLSDAFSNHLDGNIEIPQYGMVRSLNISVACAVILFEVLRQRERQGKYESLWDENKKALQERYHVIQEQKIDSDYPVRR